MTDEQQLDDYVSPANLMQADTTVPQPLVTEQIPIQAPTPPQIVAQPTPQPVIPVELPDINMTTGKPVDLSKQRHFLAAFFFSFFFGIFGVDRFYMGKFWTGILKLLTIGGLGVWATIDLGRIISGSMRDKQGNKLIDADRYKRFAKRTVFWTTTLLLVFVVGTLAISAYCIMLFMQNGGMEKMSDLVMQYMSGSAVTSTTGIDATKITQSLTSEQLQAILQYIK